MTGKRLKRERIARGLSIRELAKLSKVSASTISYYERGARGVYGRTLRALILALKKSPMLPEL